MSDKQVILEVSALKKRFKAQGPWVADGISFKLAQGEILSVAGPSGCGKTTLIRMIAGFETFDAGSIEVLAKGVGMVFQDHALFPHLTAAQNAGFGLHRLPAPARAARVKEILSLCRLEGLEGRYPRELSGGQQQRLALARALAPQPELLLMDEPFNTLDPNTKDELLVDIRRILKATGTTVIVITHEIKESYMLADRLLLLNHGRVQAEGLPEQLYLSPPDYFTAAYLGPVNRLRCAVRGMGLFRPEQVEKVEAGGQGLAALCQAQGGQEWIYFRARVLDRRFVGPWQEVQADFLDCHCPMEKIGRWREGENLLLRLSHQHRVEMGQEIFLRVKEEFIQFLEAERRPASHV